MQVGVIKRLVVILALLAGLGVWLFFDEEEGMDYHILDGRCFGTYYHIKIRTHQRDETLQELIEQELAQVSKHMSIHDEHSELVMINKAEAGGWIPISAEMDHVLRQADDIYRVSEGSFDPTVSSLLELWGFGKNKKKNIPQAALIATQLEHIGFSKIKLHHREHKLKKQSDQMAINLSAIAKGYGVDRIVTLLKSRGYQNFIVEIGGEVYAAGKRSEDEIGWNVAIERPDAIMQAQDLHLVMQLNDKALATSGSYRNYFTERGQTYAHTIDPKTGYPVENGLISVSVLSSSAMRADALATAIMAMPRDKILPFIHRNQLAVIYLQSNDGIISQYISEHARSCLAKGNKGRF